jgi:hypothetical protein
VPIARRLATSQIRTCPSGPDVTSVSPSGLTSTPDTVPAWARKAGAVGRRRLAEKSRTRSASLPASSRRRSREKPLKVGKLSSTRKRASLWCLLDRLAALNPKVAVAGHKTPGAADTPAAIEASKRYLTDFGRLQEDTSSDRELYDPMTEIYPDWVSHQAWLMFGFPMPTRQ